MDLLHGFLARRVPAVAPIARTRSVRESRGARPARRQSRATSAWQQPQLRMCVGGKAVANSPHCCDPAVGTGERELAPQATGVTVDGARFALRAKTPYVADPLILGEDAVRVTCEMGEQRVLLATQIDRRQSERDLTRRRVDLERPVAEHLGGALA